jgi:DNA repair exonuclease SbcCD ATPase subunit
VNDVLPGDMSDRHYEMLLRTLEQDHREYIERTRRQKSLLKGKVDELQTKRETMQIALIEGTKELVRNKTEKEELEMRLEQVQSSLEGRITALRRQFEDVSGTTDLKQQNEELRSTIKELKVLFVREIGG